MEFCQSSAALGLSGFALTTWMLSMVNVGWFTGPRRAPCPLCQRLYSSGALRPVLAAGLMEMPRGNTFGFVARPAACMAPLWTLPRCS